MRLHNNVVLVSVYVVCSSLQHRAVVYQIAKPRFAKVDDDEIASTMECRTSDNTKKIMLMAVKVLSAYCLTIIITMEYIELLLI